jgi:carbamoyl-phosphate synthase small subunit
MKSKPVFSVQFHPEAAPGPHDAHDIFAEFFMMMREKMKYGETN